MVLVRLDRPHTSSWRDAARPWAGSPQIVVADPTRCAMSWPQTEPDGDNKSEEKCLTEKAPYKSVDQLQLKAARLKRVVTFWFSRSRLSTVAPFLSFDPPTPRQPRGRADAYTAATGARYTPPLASSAQTMRAILLASATRTSIGGLRASMRPSHEPAGTPLRAAQRATALAPMISKRRSERSPILEVLPSRSLPPLER